MTFLTETVLMNPNQLLDFHYLLAAVGAGALFLFEGALLGILVFAGAKTAGESRAAQV